MLYCKNGRSRSLRRCHKRRGASLGVRHGVFPKKRLSTRTSLRWSCATTVTARLTSSSSAVPGRRTCVRAGPISSTIGRESCNSRVRKSRSAASRKKASSTSSAIRAARSSTSTTSSSSRTRSSTSWCGTSRAPSMRRTATRARRPRSAWRWSPPAPASPMRSPASPPRTWTRSRWSCITGQVPTHAIGQDAFQECDTVGITRPCVKHNFLVKDVQRPRASRSRRRSTSRPPAGRARCWSTSPRTSRRRRTEFVYPKTVSLRSYNPVTKGHAGQIKKAVQLLLEAKRPMVYAGGGVDPERRGAAADAPRAPARLPVHQHADGPRRVSRHRSAVHRHARHARHLRVEHGDAELRRADRRSARASTTA